MDTKHLHDFPQTSRTDCRKPHPPLVLVTWITKQMIWLCGFLWWYQSQIRLSKDLMVPECSAIKRSNSWIIWWSDKNLRFDISIVNSPYCGYPSYLYMLRPEKTSKRKLWFLTDNPQWYYFLCHESSVWSLMPLYTIAVKTVKPFWNCWLKMSTLNPQDVITLRTSS